MILIIFYKHLKGLFLVNKKEHTFNTLWNRGIKKVDRTIP